jgi:RNA polymerase subunit RPABC4/transcription elongation factor Spt4
MQKKYCIQCGALLEAGESLCTDCKANLGQKEENYPQVVAFIQENIPNKGLVFGK